MQSTALLSSSSITLLLIAQQLSAGPLVEKQRAEQAAAVASALAAQQVMRPFNPVGPFVDHYYRQFANEGFVRTPVSPAQMNLLKARLVWEYGPLSSQALGHIENLNDIVFAISRENPSLLNNPAELADEITRKVSNLANREKTFQGLQGEASEARFRGWVLTKDAQSKTFDLHDPQTKSSYQMKVWKTGADSLRGLREDYADLTAKHPNKAQFFKGMMADDQIQELVKAGKLTKSSTPVKTGTQSGLQAQTAYVDVDTGMKIIAAKSEPTAKQFRANVRKGYALEERLSQRPAGFGRASVGGFVVGSGVSILIQTYQGEDMNWSMVAESGGIGLASSAAMVVVAQQIEQRFGKQVAQSFIAKNLLPGLARGSLSGAAASTGVGTVVVLGFVAKDYFTDQITANEALIHSGIGVSSVGAGVSASLIAAWAVGGSAFGPAGTVAGIIAGTAVYLGGEWYYESFKLEGIRAEMAAFKAGASKWEANKLDQEIKSLRGTASELRRHAASTLP